MKTKVNVKRLFPQVLFFVLFVSISLLVAAQKKKLKEKFKMARDSSTNYVIFKSGEKKDIKSATFPTRYEAANRMGKIIFTDGSTLKYGNKDVHVIQTDEGYYKLVEYSITSFHEAGLAVRQAKGVYNVFQILTLKKKPFSYEYEGNVLYYFEKEGSESMTQLHKDPKMVDYVDSLVSKSKLAREAIVEIRKSYSELQKKWLVESKLAEIFELYNKDATEGKLEN